MDNQEYYSRTRRNKNVNRLNDQLIPKPTEVNVADKMMSAVTLKEHPFSSHMSRLAVFPSFFSSDDSESGFRSTSQTSPDSCVPNRDQNVILLSKTKGYPYRHEIIEAPVKTKETSKGEKYSLDYTKLKKGENPIFYTTLMKPILPKPKQHDLYISKSTRNMLESLQKKLWVTSYQVDYTGIHPANTVKIFNHKEASDIDGIDPFSTSLEIPHKHRVRNKGCAHEGRHKENCKVRFDERLTQESKSHKSQEGNAAHITEQRLDLYSRPHSHMRMSRESRPAELNTKVLPNDKKEELTVANPQPVLAKNRSSHVEFLSGWSSEQEGLTERREPRHGVPSPHSFPSVQQRTGSGNQAGPVTRAGPTASLLELQNSFSKSDAQRNFNSSVTRTVVNLRDNVTSGKKHNFYGINCNYIHG